MFVEEKTQGEVTEAPAKVTKLSEAMRIGFPSYTRVKLVYISPKLRQCCAIGGAALAAGYDGSGDDFHHADKVKGFLISRFPGVTFQLVSDASARHTMGETPEQIADWLESRGL